MNDWFDKYYEAIAITFVALFIFILMLICGCHTLQPLPKIPDLNPSFGTIYKTNWLMSISIITVGIGAFVLFMGNQWGLRLAVAAIVTIITLLTITKYALYFSIVGLIAVVALFVYSIWAAKREKTTLSMALTETVKGIEEFKLNNKSLDVKGLINSLHRVFDSVQSDTTKAMVEKIKNGGKT